MKTVTALFILTLMSCNLDTEKTNCTNDSIVTDSIKIDSVKIDSVNIIPTDTIGTFKIVKL